MRIPAAGRLAPYDSAGPPMPVGQSRCIFWLLVEEEVGKEVGAMYRAYVVGGGGVHSERTVRTQGKALRRAK